MCQTRRTENFGSYGKIGPQKIKFQNVPVADGWSQGAGSIFGADSVKKRHPPAAGTRKNTDSG
jgi:hypothetical protein